MLQASSAPELDVVGLFPVGRVYQIFWPAEAQGFAGRVEAIHETERGRRFLVSYDDGDQGLAKPSDDGVSLVECDEEPLDSLDAAVVLDRPPDDVVLAQELWGGVVVWVRLAKDGWWPAQIVAAQDAQDRTPSPKGCLTVRCFGNQVFVIMT